MLIQWPLGSTLTCVVKRGTESWFIWIIDLPISHQVLPSVKLLIRWVSWVVSRLGHHKWHLKTVTLMMRFQVLHCLVLWNLFFLLQHHVFLEHTDPTYEFCGIQRTWETCHWCKVLLNLLLWPGLLLNHAGNSFFHGLHSHVGWWSDWHRQAVCIACWPCNWHTGKFLCTLPSIKAHFQMSPL